MSYLRHRISVGGGSVVGSLLLLVTAAHGEAVDLLKRYPTKLTVGDAAPGHARPWAFTAADVFRVSQFTFTLDEELKIEIGPGDLGIGHCADGAVWAIVIPRDKGTLNGEAAKQEESVAHVWLRFHPKEINRLFPPETVSTDGATNLAAQMRAIAQVKFLSSWHAGPNAMIPEPKDLTVDVDTKGGLRRFFAVDTDAQTARYVAAFENRNLKPPPAFSSDSAAAAFDQLWKAFDRDYAMFVLRPDVDWAQLREQYRPKALASKSTHEFAEVCADMLKPLRDLHVWMTVAGVNVPVFNRPRSANSNPSAHRAILGSLKQAGRLQWAVTSDQIGFIAIYGWNTGPEIPAQVDEALEEMRDTRGLIVDVRLNGGGDEPTAGKVAGRFLPKEFVYSYSQYRNGPNHTNLTAKYERKVAPRGPWRYNRPVVLLIGQKCMSSNESFIAMMSGDPEITIMGDRTCGSSGNPRIVKLPLDLTVSVPRWIDYLPDGAPLDERGFQPQIPFKPKPGAFAGERDDLLAAALERLRQGPLVSTAPGGHPLTNLVRTYTVNQSVSDFPTNEDLSTPEAAYATCNRLCASGEQGRWRKLSVKRLAERMPAGKKIEVRPSAAQEWLIAEILEVHIYRDTVAMAFARIPHPSKSIIDIRGFELENGRWLNAGNDITSSLEEARKLFARRCAYFDAERQRSSRPPIAHPDEHLRPFVEFLKREAADPQDFLLKALANHRVVILGEVHHRPRYWEFNSALVRMKEFPQKAGVVYMELPSNDQALVNQFLAGPKYDPAPVIEMLRDMLWMGWPDQSMLDFFKTVWEVNQTLPEERRLRIVLVDMARPWQEIQKREDWRKYDVDRNQLMAENIVRDLGEHEADARHALFIVGYLHAMVNLSRPGGDPMKSAGWHLREKLGEANICAVFPHSPVMANMGGVNGRLALGLFETAFAALNNKPMAFPLEHGPFGEQVFDASLDELTADPYRNGYHAYLYLGPLEDEVFSPLIPGFYTDAFVQELERRSLVTFGKGLLEGHGIKTADAKGFIEWMSRSWGQPRREWSARSLGPLNAWQLGSDWEKKAAAAKLGDLANQTNAIRQAAQRLFDAIRKANYEKPGDWRVFPAPDVEYQVYTDYPAWMKWICQRFRTNPIVAVDLGEVTQNAENRAALPYQVTLKNGDKQEGVLPMQWDARGQQWFGVEGLDWHLGKAQPTRRPAGNHRQE